MSVPESNSKGRPSLLSEQTGAPQADDSRILANLEGRVAPPPQQPKRSRVLPAVAAVLVIALGGWGAWLATQRSTPDGATRVAAVSENAVRKSDAAVVASDALASTSAAASVAASGSALSSASPDGASAATVAAVVASGASVSTAATIVADDDTAKATQSAQPAQPASDDANRLSRALSAGTEPSGNAASSALAGSKQNSEQKSEASVGTKHGAHAQKLANVSHDRHQAAANERHGKDKTRVVAHADSKKSTAKRDTHDDSDADLLAALVARTKPADPKGINAVAASGPSAAAPAKKVSTNASGSLADRINECSQHGFFEEQLCRWRACDGHWGKDPHCPATSAQARQP